MNLQATQAEPEPAARPAAMKFTYPGGSRPLEGFTIKRGIGRGGFGEVYYATSDAGKEVAIKLIRRNLDVELRGVTQCLNLKHPNLLSLFDVKQDELGDSWVVMEYVAGESLEGALARHPDGLPRQEVLAWFHGIAAGVTYLHEHGIVHRDLKPGNIFSDDGLVKIGDYGLSKFISASRRSGQTESVGTVHYMAPEIGNGRYGKEIDIYALGIILYEMLTGHVPFEGESVGEVLMKHLTAEPNLAGIEEPYRSAIAKTLTKDPDARIKTVGELVALLPGPPPSVFMGANGPGVGASAPAASPASPRRKANPASDIVSAMRVGEEEPIARAVRIGLRLFFAAWIAGRISMRGKVAIMLVAGFPFILFALDHRSGVPPFVLRAYGSKLVTMAVTVLMMYAAYYALRAIAIACRATMPAEPLRAAGRRPTAPVEAPVMPTPVTHTNDPTAAMRELHVAAPVKPAPAVSRPVAPLYRRRARPENAIVLPEKTVRQRIEELTGSLLAAAVVAAAMSVFLSVIHTKTLQIGQFAWLLIVSTLGAWLVLVCGKFWEAGDGDSSLRRLTLMVSGLGLGAAAWTVKDFLFVPLNADWKLPELVTGDYVGPRFYELDGSPSLVAHMAYFAFLMLVVRWWKQADPRRPARLRIWPAVVAVFWAWLLSFFWPFPQPWGAMMAASMSIAVQASATWEKAKRRVVES